MTKPFNYELVLSNLTIAQASLLEDYKNAKYIKLCLARDIDADRRMPSHDSSRLLNYLQASAVVDSIEFKMREVDIDIEKFKKESIGVGKTVIYKSPLSETLVVKDKMNNKTGVVLEVGKMYKVNIEGHPCEICPSCLFPAPAVDTPA